MIQLYTPTSILACVTDDEGVPIDCFADAIPETNPYKDTLSSMLWARYRYSMINSVCLDRWLQRVKDTALLIDQRYQMLIAEFETRKEAMASIMRTGSSETYHDVHTSVPTGSDKVVTENEDLPQSESAEDSRWLSDRNTSTSTPGVTVTDTTDGTREIEQGDALNAEQYRKVLDNLRDPYVAYTDEFAGLFVNYFDMYGGCCGCRSGMSSSCKCPALYRAGSIPFSAARRNPWRGIRKLPSPARSGMTCASRSRSRHSAVGAIAT